MYSDEVCNKSNQAERQADQQLDTQTGRQTDRKADMQEGIEGYLHGSAFAGDQREAHNVREVHGDGREQLRLHVLSRL